ncbi:MAG: hypothetical protein M1819_001223 [Sarea resinae]|nr:MAG: hypothetical protein M1819_001223 [Sarea resinae]
MTRHLDSPLPQERQQQQHQQHQQHQQQQQHSLKEADLIAFDSAAAGHEGVMSDASGSLIIKPCTAAEIAFYESALNHPELAAYMPTFMGTLSLGPPPNEVSEEAIAAASDALTTATPIAVPITSSSSASADSEPATTAATAAAVADAVASSNAAITSAASPSTASLDARSPTPPPPLRLRGKKLDTGLSIVLANATAGFKHPNVLDVKLGARLWDDDAPPEKRARLDQVSKETTSGSLGFRIAGMKIWRGGNAASSSDASGDAGATEADVNGNGCKRSRGEAGTVSDAQSREEKDTKIEIDADGYQTYDKLYGRSLTAENIHEGFREFFKLSRDTTSANANLSPPNSKCRPSTRFHIIRDLFNAYLTGLQSVLEDEECRLYSASILFVYEGDAEALETAIEDEEERQEEMAKRLKGQGKRKDDAMPAEEIGEEGSTIAEAIQIGGSGVAVASATASGQNAAASFFENGTGAAEDGSEDFFDEDSGEESDEEDRPKILTLKLIDFAHAQFVPGQGADENVLRGIRSVTSILEGLEI